MTMPEYVETNKPHGEAMLVFERLRCLYETKKLENNHPVSRKGYLTYVDLPNH